MYLQNELAINEERYEQGIKEGKEQGIKEGKEQGIKEGMEKGKEQGKKEEKIGIAKNLLSINLPLEQIAVATGLSVDEIKSIKSN